MLEIVKLLRRHDVSCLSPAVISHAIITVVRKFCNNAELITPEIMASSVPGPMKKIISPVIERAERFLRRWLQNVQGVWKDGLVAKRGKLWLPSDGKAYCLEVIGENLDIAGQRIKLLAGGKTVSTEALDSGQPFNLKLIIPAGNIPVRAEFICATTITVAPLEPRYGPRRAGCHLKDCRLVTP